MGSPSSSTPKLSLYSFPSKRKEPSGMILPPINASVSIPFLWEEAPGKPRRPYQTSENETDTGSRSKPNVTRCLQLPLPPRLLAESKVASMPSATTVLGGSDESLRRVNKEKVKFGSSRWGSFRKAGRVVQESFDGGDAEVKITRVRKKASFLNLYQARSHVLASIYESFKQVVPWRRGLEKMKKMAS
ncbi:hypothetical protein V6N13_108675 [Hibiscus sabdariffa]|uniref:Uncharacterized protein n=1 Tax=Hibiscus sabdariffa TaxID=183260 RepID=A0ABR2STL5_9ROSI